MTRPLRIPLLFALLVLTACADHPPDRPAQGSNTSSTQPRNTAEPAPAGVTEAELTAHAQSLRKRYADQGFTITIEPPFVVIGDESTEMVRRRSEQTVRWAVDRLQRDYFPIAPDHVITIWLFKDRKSYESNTQRIFNEKPHTPFGYYASRHNALIMNIATGGGTLVHEIVHPLMAANFPECPAWFNEGLGSLYEQCRDKDGRIHGTTNWRLEGLQRAIQNDRALDFNTLCTMSDARFYNDANGLHYAQARYLCYDLQQRGLLRTFYRRFRANHETDPTGFETLRAVIEDAGMNMRTYQRRWHRRTRQLTFP